LGEGRLPTVAAEWQAAMEALILVATSGGPTMLPRTNEYFRRSRKSIRIWLESVKTNFEAGLCLIFLLTQNAGIHFYI
jgi:hypothetical protein